jgi:hypothetical protein
MAAPLGALALNLSIVVKKLVSFLCSLAAIEAGKLDQ